MPIGVLSSYCFVYFRNRGFGFWFLSSFEVLRKINSFDLFFPHFLFFLLFPFLFRSFAVLLYRNRKER